MAQISNLGQIIGEMMKQAEEMQYRYEMMCEVSAEFTPLPNYDIIWDSVCKKFNVDSDLVGMELLRRVEFNKRMIDVFYMIPIGCMEDFVHEQDIKNKNLDKRAQIFNSSRICKNLN